MMGIPFWSLPRLMREGRKMMSDRICEVSPSQGISEALGSIYNKDLVLGIVTSNSSENVRKWLEHHNLLPYFTTILGGGRLLKKDRCIKRAMSRLMVETDQILYVGDEVRDLEACKRLSIQCVGVTWGLDLVKDLDQHGPYALISEPAQLVEIVEHHQKSAA